MSELVITSVTESESFNLLSTTFNVDDNLPSRIIEHYKIECRLIGVDLIGEPVLFKSNDILFFSLADKEPMVEIKSPSNGELYTFTREIVGMHLTLRSYNRYMADIISKPGINYNDDRANDLLLNQYFSLEKELYNLLVELNYSDKYLNFKTLKLN